MSDSAVFEQTDLYAAGEEGCHTFRIPSVVVTPQGSMLAFCEARKNARSDTGDIAMVVRRSVDGGKGWSKAKVVWDDKGNTCGNPCPVVDTETGAVWLLMTHNLGCDHQNDIMGQTGRGTRTVWVTRSTDDGVTWSQPIELTDAVKRPEWTWYATGPGAGIQLRSGRLVIPCNHAQAGEATVLSHVICSDDGGASWQLGGSTPQGAGECQAVEREDGSLLMNMRNADRSQTARLVSTSEDGGLTWSAIEHDEALIEPVCQASICRLTGGEGGGRSRILFSNPASTNARESMTVRLSYDEGRTWPVAKVIHRGPSAYSCLAVLPDLRMACLYERGHEHPYEKLSLALFNLAWLTDEQDA